MKKLLLLTGIVAAMVVSCTKSEEMATVVADSAISFGVGDLSTRVTDGASLKWDVGDQVTITDGTTDDNNALVTGLYLCTEVEDSNPVEYKLVYSTESASTKFKTNKGEEQTFYGWSGVAAEYTDKDGVLSLDVSGDQDSEKGKDLAKNQALVGTATTKTADAEFTFAPIYTKVVFKITGTTLTEATATLTGANTEGRYNYKDGFVAADFTSSEITPIVEVDSNINESGTTTIVTVTAYVLETETMNGELVILSDGKKLYSIPIENKKWEEGKVYNYDIDISTSQTVN